jgi:hypothetical protein
MDKVAKALYRTKKGEEKIILFKEFEDNGYSRGGYTDEQTGYLDPDKTHHGKLIELRTRKLEKSTWAYTTEKLRELANEIVLENRG